MTETHTACLLAALLLGHEDFASRQRAECLLRECYPLSAPALRLALAAPDPEAACRAARLLDAEHAAECERLSRTMSPKGWAPGVMPCLDALPAEPGRRETLEEYLGRSRQYVEGTQANGWQDYREATRIYVQERLYLRSMSVGQAQAFLDDLAARDNTNAALRRMPGVD